MDVAQKGGYCYKLTCLLKYCLLKQEIIVHYSTIDNSNTNSKIRFCGHFLKFKIIVTINLILFDVGLIMLLSLVASIDGCMPVLETFHCIFAICV